jgi:MFS transporter, PPP family, 3-phenylpropionic acid transporter
VSTHAPVRPSVAVHGLFVVFGFVIAAFFPFLAIYLEGRGLDGGEIGLVIAAMALARIVFNPLWGHLADTKIGRLTALQIGTVGAALGAVVLIRVDSVTAIAAAGFMIAAFMVATGPNLDSIALQHLGDEQMSDYGRLRGWESLAYAAGCLVFGAILETEGVRWAMPIYAMASLAVLVWSTTLSRDRPTALAVHSRLGSVGAVFREAPRFWGFLAALLLVWTGFNAAWNFIALKIVSEGGGPLLIGIGTALGGLVEVPVMRSSSRMHTRWGVRRTYVVGCIVYATGFLLWGLISNPTIVSILTVFDGMAFGILFTTGVVVVGRLLPSGLYSTGNAVAGMVGFGLGPVIGAGIGGFVYQHLGPVVLYCGASVLALGGALAAWFALDIPELEGPDVVSAEDLPADPFAAPPEPLG